MGLKRVQKVAFKRSRKKKKSWNSVKPFSVQKPSHTPSNANFQAYLQKGYLQDAAT